MWQLVSSESCDRMHCNTLHCCCQRGLRRVYTPLLCGLERDGKSRDRSSRCKSSRPSSRSSGGMRGSRRGAGSSQACRLWDSIRNRARGLPDGWSRPSRRAHGRRIEGKVALFRKGPQDIEAGPVVREDLIPGVDLAILLCPFFRPSLPFRSHLPARVSAAGYPYAVDTERLALVPRGFAGHVVTRRELYTCLPNLRDTNCHFLAQEVCQGRR